MVFYLNTFASDILKNLKKQSYKERYFIRLKIKSIFKVETNPKVVFYRFTKLQKICPTSKEFKLLVFNGLST